MSHQHQFSRANEEFQEFLANHLQNGSFGALPEVPPAPVQRGARYLPDPDREEFFRNERRLKQLLEDVLQTDQRYSVRVDALRKDYTRVFSTLLSIERGGAIVHFMSKPGLSDSHFPFKTGHLFPSRISDETFFDDFYKKQWMFCAPKLTRDRPDWFEWEPERILPVNYRELGKGGSGAKIFEMKVHPGHNDLLPHESVKVRR